MLLECETWMLGPWWSCFIDSVLGVPFARLHRFWGPWGSSLFVQCPEVSIWVWYFEAIFGRNCKLQLGNLCLYTTRAIGVLVSVFFHMHSIPCGFFNVDKVLVLSKPQNTNTYWDWKNIVLLNKLNPTLFSLLLSFIYF